MPDQISNVPPPGYGSVTTNPQSYPPPGGQPAGMAQPNEAPPPYNPVSQQPGNPPVAYPSTTPSDPPPKYEPADTPMGQPPAGYVYGPPPMGPAYPGQPGYQIGGPGTHQTVVLTQPLGWGPGPRTIECPNCRALVTSSINFRPGGLAWLASGLICLFGCWAGCCLIPFCLPDLQDVEHTCPNCEARLGTYHRL